MSFIMSNLHLHVHLFTLQNRIAVHHVTNERRR